MRFARLRTALLTAVIATLALTVTTRADSPGRGKTAAFEREFLQFIIDHHFSALRVTELAAGTDLTRDATISPAEGTAPSPDFGSTPPKAGLEEIKSMARRANRTQREEILEAAKMLRDWYGVSYQPKLTPSGQALIQALSARSPGADFDQAFLTLFPKHHFTAIQSAAECLAGRDPAHDDLRRYCQGILEGQLNEVDSMRHLLCTRFNVCDLLPFDTTTASKQQ
jgi:uncharacterized protein (DUF305 family)